MNTTKRNALGRGLGALLSNDINESIKNTQPPISGTLGRILLTQIETNPYQPRTDFPIDALQELAASIVLHGIIQPITVRKLGYDHYQLVSGERRLRASKIAELKDIPAYVLETDNQGMIEMALIENIQRENLNAMEIAFAYRRLIDECSLKQEELGDRVGKNRTTVTNFLRLLKLPPVIQIGIRDAKLSMGHARALINIKEVSDQISIYDQIIKNDLTVRKVEELVRILEQPKAEKEPIAEKPKNDNPHQVFVLDVQEKLRMKLDSKVQIKHQNSGKGEIIIPYLSNDDLNRMLDILEASAPNI